MNIKKERHKVAPARFAAGEKAQGHKGKIKNSVPLCLYAYMPNKRGFTLIELMAVIAIIMILASIMIPNVVKNVERGREAKANADIDILIKAINLFQIDNSKLPDTLEELLVKGVEYGPYISDSAIAKDPWGTAYSYSPGQNSYTIGTTSKGGKVISKTINF